VYFVVLYCISKMARDRAYVMLIIDIIFELFICAKSITLINLERSKCMMQLRYCFFSVQPTGNQKIICTPRWAHASSADLHVLVFCSDLQFVRAEGWVFAHIGDEGYVESCAAGLARYRRHLDAEHVLIFTDIKKKHRQL